jgi:hypothetical protein
MRLRACLCVNARVRACASVHSCKLVCLCVCWHCARGCAHALCKRALVHLHLCVRACVCASVRDRAHRRSSERPFALLIGPALGRTARVSHLLRAFPTYCARFPLTARVSHLLRAFPTYCAAAAKLNRERKRVARNRQLRHALEVLMYRQHGTEPLATDARPVWFHTVRTTLQLHTAQRYTARCNRRQPCEFSSADADSRRAAEAVSKGCGAAPPGRVSGHCIAQNAF